MSRKRNPYIPLFTHDIMSSMKCRRLSMRATGLYLWLLCLMNEKPQQGRWALSTNEDHPTWKNSLTYRALQNTDKYGRLPMFATLMARKFLPWKSGEVLKALQELYRFKLIVVEDDAIIQPRMYRDNGFKLREDTMREYLKDDLGDDEDGAATGLPEASGKTAGSDSKKDGKKGTLKGTNKVPQKVHEIHAHAQNSESESENNINNNKGIIGGMGEIADKTEVDDGEKIQDAPRNITFDEFWEAYDKQVNMIEAQAHWDILSAKDREAVMAYLPKYKHAQPLKKFRKNPVTFLRLRAWEDELITANTDSNETANRHNGGHQSQRAEVRDRDILEQSQRIIERKLRKNESDTE